MDKGDSSNIVESSSCHLDDSDISTRDAVGCSGSGLEVPPVGGDTSEVALPADAAGYARSGLELPQQVVIHRRLLFLRAPIMTQVP
jgi:hypothetical protein